MPKNYFIKKSIKNLLDEASESKSGLKKTLGALNLTNLGIGAIIGAGIFVLTGQAAAQYAGPAIIFSFILAAIICAFTALCYAELASLIPVAGSAYSYAYVALGELPAWIIGWGLTLEYLFAAATVAIGWSSYFISLLKDFDIELPKALASGPLSYDVIQGWQSTGSIINLPGMLVIGLIGILIALGIKAATSFNNLMVVIKIGIIALFIGCGIFFINPANWHPFVPANIGVFGQFGFSGILRAAGIVFFAFIGFDCLSTLAQESKNPQKDLPIGMLGSLGVSTFLYILVALVLTGIVSYTNLNVVDPIAVAVNTLGSKFVWLRFVIKLAILAGITSTILVMLMGQARIFYTMAQDGLLPAFFGKIHKKFRTPFNGTLSITAIAIAVIGFFPVSILAPLVSMGTLLGFAIVCFGVLVLRVKQPHLHRPFKTPFVPWVPLIGTLICILQMLALPGVTWMQFFIWMSIGLLIYLGWGYKHSVVRFKIKKR